MVFHGKKLRTEKVPMFFNIRTFSLFQQFCLFPETADSFLPQGIRGNNLNVRPHAQQPDHQFRLIGFLIVQRYMVALQTFLKGYITGIIQDNAVFAISIFL